MATLCERRPLKAAFVDGLEKPNLIGYEVMVTVYREGGFRVVIYRDDHEPAHVHVIKDGEVIVNLMGADGSPEVRQTSRMTKADLRKSLRIVTGQQTELLAKWQEIHGGID